MKKYINIFLLLPVLVFGYDFSKRNMGIGFDAPVVKAGETFAAGGSFIYDTHLLNLCLFSKLNIVGILHDIGRETPPNLEIGLTYHQNIFTRRIFGGVYVGRKFK
jgi:hypothetical protein